MSKASRRMRDQRTPAQARATGYSREAATWDIGVSNALSDFLTQYLKDNPPPDSSKIAANVRAIEREFRQGVAMINRAAGIFGLAK